jgi:3-dehydroquinate dehydratase-2
VTDPLIALISGPNLTLLGERQPLIYGRSTLDDLAEIARSTAVGLGYDFEHVQSDHEAELVAAVHGLRHRAAALVVNAAALTHYGWSLRDALATFEGPIIELHISNPFARERWRHTSVLSGIATGSIAGLGPVGYRLAIEAAHALIG